VNESKIYCKSIRIRIQKEEYRYNAEEKNQEGRTKRIVTIKRERGLLIARTLERKEEKENEHSGTRYGNNQCCHYDNDGSKGK